MFTVEVRCPNNYGRLFTKLKLSVERPKVVEGNLMEYACADCKKDFARQGVVLTRVLHRYNFLGELVQTVDQEGNSL